MFLALRNQFHRLVANYLEPLCHPHVVTDSLRPDVDRDGALSGVAVDNLAEHEGGRLERKLHHGGIAVVPIDPGARRNPQLAVTRVEMEGPGVAHDIVENLETEPPDALPEVGHVAEALVDQGLPPLDLRYETGVTVENMDSERAYSLCLRRGRVEPNRFVARRHAGSMHPRIEVDVDADTRVATSGGLGEELQVLGPADDDPQLELSMPLLEIQEAAHLGRMNQGIGQDDLSRAAAGQDLGLSQGCALVGRDTRRKRSLQDGGGFVGLEMRNQAFGRSAQLDRIGKIMLESRFKNEHCRRFDRLRLFHTVVTDFEHRFLRKDDPGASRVAAKPPVATAPFDGLEGWRRVNPQQHCFAVA